MQPKAHSPDKTKGLTRTLPVDGRLINSCEANTREKLEELTAIGESCPDL